MFPNLKNGEFAIVFYLQSANGTTSFTKQEIGQHLRNWRKKRRLTKPDPFVELGIATAILPGGNKKRNAACLTGRTRLSPVENGRLVIEMSNLLGNLISLDALNVCLPGGNWIVIKIKKTDMQ